MAGRPNEAKARLALLVAQLDQVACDRGQWLIASEASLESTGPPFSAFARHSPPDPNETQFSRLLDARWVEAFVSKVKDQEDYIERRDRLGRRKPFTPPESPSEAELARAKAKAKAKADAKGAGSRGDGREGAANLRNFCAASGDRPQSNRSGSCPQPTSSTAGGISSGSSRVPGALASTVKPESWWNSCFWLSFKSGGSFATLCKSLLRAAPPSPELETTGRLWPLPVPYPQVLRREAGPKETDFALKRAICMEVIALTLNWLFLRRPPLASATASGYAPEPLAVASHSRAGAPVLAMEWKIGDRIRYGSWRLQSGSFRESDRVPQSCW